MKLSIPTVAAAFSLLALSWNTAWGQKIEVEATSKPGNSWKSYPTRTLDDLPPSVRNTQDSQLTKYGGRADRKAKATGFFYPARLDGRWWLVDPAGGLFIHKAVVSVGPLRTAGAQAEFDKSFGDLRGWAAQTTRLLQTNGFNGTGAWSTIEEMRKLPDPLVYTKIWNFMSSYGKKRGGTFQQPGHTGYPNDCIFVFDPAFETFCEQFAKQLGEGKNDPWLLGHFSDNELPLRTNALKNYLELPASDPGNQAARKWLQSRHGESATVADITPQDRMGFLKQVIDRYFRIVAQAIKKNDPNHLFLGSRFHGSDLRFPEVFAAAGPYLDVIAVNYYGAWTPDKARMVMWEKESGRPVIITEWYVKGADSGLPNKGGAGWVVKTQQDRGWFYENFVLGLLESKVCVGWHWFKYIDNDPADAKADPSNQDSNKGIVNNRYRPYPPLLNSMRRMNERAYGIADYFDQ